MPLIENPIEDGGPTKSCMTCRYMETTPMTHDPSVERKVCSHALRVIYTMPPNPIYKPDVFPYEWCQLWEEPRAAET